MNGFLPVSRQDMQARGWEECDFVYVVADAHVDHPTFGHAIISRVLEHAGYRVGIIPQPDWKDPASVMVLGAPRLAFLVAGGNMDSLVNHYTVAKRRRSMDYYSPGGKMGLRPDRATIVYSNLIRQACPGKPVIIGGIIVVAILVAGTIWMGQAAKQDTDDAVHVLAKVCEEKEEIII